MFKTLCAVFVLIASSVALAYPTIGDYSKLAGTITVEGEAAASSIENTILDFNAATNHYTVLEIYTLGFDSLHVTYPVPAGDMLSKTEVAQILAFCGMYGGTNESVTVAAGDFATCKAPITDQNGNHNGFVWIGDVAFGVVKVFKTESDGSIWDLELETFTSAR